MSAAELDVLGRRVDPVDMSESLKDAIATCYGLLWHVQTDSKYVHRARRGLLQWLTKDEQGQGIDNARAIALANLIPLPPALDALVPAGGAPADDAAVDYYTVQSALRPHMASMTELMSAMSSIWPLIDRPAKAVNVEAIKVESAGMRGAMKQAIDELPAPAEDAVVAWERIVERVLTRRVLQDRIDGYTLETSKEIVAALLRELRTLIGAEEQVT